MLERADLAPDPIAQFRSWFEEAQAGSGLLHPEAMCLSTAGEDGLPEGRIVLLKDYDEEGFVFYTDLRSRKVRSLRRTQAAALTFHWEVLQRQVRIRGSVSAVETGEADAYFGSRPRGSQIGAWASLQSESLESREVLEERVREVEERLEGQVVPRPSHWGGLRVRPGSVEFWQGRPDRLHDRFEYRRSGGGWEIVRLYP